jgi:hypothetical protein
MPTRICRVICPRRTAAIPGFLTTSGRSSAASAPCRRHTRRPRRVAGRAVERPSPADGLDGGVDRCSEAGSLVIAERVAFDVPRVRARRTPPQVYAEPPGLADGYGPALARLETAIEDGRHDALLITDPGAVTGTELAVMTSRAEGPEPRKSPRLLDPLPARWKPDTDSAEAAPGRRHTDLEPNRAAAELRREAAGPGLGQAG